MPAARCSSSRQDQETRGSAGLHAAEQLFLHLITYILSPPFLWEGSVAYNHTYDSAYILPHKDYFLLGYFPQEIYGLVLHLPYAFLTQYTLFTLLLSA